MRSHLPSCPSSAADPAYGHLVIQRMRRVLAVLADYAADHARGSEPHSPLWRTVAALKIAQATVLCAERDSAKTTGEGSDASEKPV